MGGFRAGDSPNSGQCDGASLLNNGAIRGDQVIAAVPGLARRLSHFFGDLREKYDFRHGTLVSGRRWTERPSRNDVSSP